MGKGMEGPLHPTNAPQASPQRFLWGVHRENCSGFGEGSRCDAKQLPLVVRGVLVAVGIHRCYILLKVGVCILLKVRVQKHIEMERFGYTAHSLMCVTRGAITTWLAAGHRQSPA